jgi:hypothetical protein
MMCFGLLLPEAAATLVEDDESTDNVLDAALEAKFMDDAD